MRNAIVMMGAPQATALRMTSGHVARALGLDGELGRIAPGYRASIILLDGDLHATGVIVDGLAM